MVSRVMAEERVLMPEEERWGGMGRGSAMVAIAPPAGSNVLGDTRGSVGSNPQGACAQDVFIVWRLGSVSAGASRKADKKGQRE